MSNDASEHSAKKKKKKKRKKEKGILHNFDTIPTKFFYDSNFLRHNFFKIVKMFVTEIFMN